MSRKLGGRGRLMRPALAFAEQHGFSIAFTQRNHLVFSGHGRCVFAAGTPRSMRAALTAVSKMKAILREQVANYPR
jgi:hypothetical protein